MSDASRLLPYLTAAFLLLDLGLSLNARIGYSTPTERWQPAPERYADLTWPPGADLAEDIPLGERVYARHCAVCHGPDGRGNGPAAPSMIPRPRDFTLGQFKYKSTPPGQPPSDLDLIAVVSKGLPASAMPYWEDVLSKREILSVVEFIKTLSPVFRDAAAEPVPIAERPAFSEESAEAGRRLYASQGCEACHGMDARGGLKQRDAKGDPVISRDLTAPWTFRGGSEPEQIWLRLTTGLAPGPMPSFAAPLTGKQRWHLVHFLLTIQRVPPWMPGGKLAGPGQHADPVRRGEYLVHAEMCGLCHTQINRTGIYRGDDRYLAGGMRVGAYPYGVFVSRNLTPDAQTGLGRLSAEQIARAIRTGRRPGRLLNLLGMPWMFLHGLTDADAVAIGSYLKTLPAVANPIPPPLHYGIVETTVVKLYQTLTHGGVRALSYADGNYGGARSRFFPPHRIQQVLFFLEVTALIALCVLVLRAGYQKAKSRGRPHRAMRTFKKALGTAAALGVLWLWYHYPALSLIPPEEIAKSTVGAVPAVNADSRDTPELKAMAERGKYVYTVASCAFCHGPRGSGGSKVSWDVFGTLFVPNITQDVETGIGAWSDAEIQRAVRSGVSRSGRPLHWQGMIWDHAGNWDEEDIRSLIVYLKTLPAVKKTIPAPHPPSEADCAVYTFILDANAEPGCDY